MKVGIELRRWDVGEQATVPIYPYKIKYMEMGCLPEKKQKLIIDDEEFINDNGATEFEVEKVYWKQNTEEGIVRPIVVFFRY